MIKPGIGRIVHFFPAGHPAGELPHAAMVVGIHDDRTVNLAIFDREGHLYHGTDVALLQADDTPPADRGHAAWMDYQKGQAAKTEALPAEALPPAQSVTAETAETSADPTEEALRIATTMPTQEATTATVDSSPEPTAPANKPAPRRKPLRFVSSNSSICWGIPGEVFMPGHPFLTRAKQRRYSRPRA